MKRGELRVNGWPLLEGGEPEFSCSCRPGVCGLAANRSGLVECPHCGEWEFAAALIKKWKRDFL